MVRIYDTAARSVRDFEPRVEGQVSMYVCGVTPYDAPHLGHGRTAVTFDVIRRYLAWRGFTVHFVTNVTDIEDKIIARAAEQGIAERDLAVHFERVYWEQIDRLDVLRPDDLPRATEFIAQIHALISELIAAGRAYVIEGSGVYFQVDTLADYGKLSRRRLDQLLESAGARVEVDESKRSPVDFALWKAAKPGEPEWDSPWGPGRPGWHIECSAMALEILGEGFDLHGGGSDLVFPHHENEIAQAEGAGHAFARYWLHGGMVMVGKEKMGKSLGNFRLLEDAIDAHGSRAFRWLVVQHHYRNQLEINDDALRAARATIDGYDALARRLRAAGAPSVDAGDMSDFVDVMDNDFDTPNGVAVIAVWRRDANTALDEGRVTDAAAAFAKVVDAMDALGLALDDGHATTDDAVEIDALVQQRTDARANRDFARSDQIRDQLSALGIVLEDTPTGTIWHRS
jgi:cysteinyl-tRNA synthetase